MRYDGWIFRADPVDIPEVKRLVKLSTETTRCRDLCRRKEDLSSWSHPKRGQFLALDVHCLILEFLDCSDVGNYAKALEWSIPDHYWRHRAKASGLIFEYDDTLEATTIDWMFLAKEVEQLPNSSVGMQNRLRILKVLRKVSDTFQSLEHNGDMTSLQDFVKETYPPYTGPLEHDMDELWTRIGERLETLPRYMEAPSYEGDPGPRRYYQTPLPWQLLPGHRGEASDKLFKYSVPIDYDNSFLSQV